MARIDSVTATYTFTNPIQLLNCPNGTGDYLPGYFINYRTVDPCVASSTNFSVSYSMTYTYAAVNGTVYTKTNASRPIV